MMPFGPAPCFLKGVVTRPNVHLRATFHPLPPALCLYPSTSGQNHHLVGTADLLQQGVTLASFSGVQQANVWKHIIATINSASQANQHLIKQLPSKEVGGRVPISLSVSLACWSNLGGCTHWWYHGHSHEPQPLQV
jgi:hypothetical protein